MADFDEVMMGLFISSFSIIGIACTAWCVRECRNRPTMKKSTSSQELNSMNDSDPEIII